MARTNARRGFSLIEVLVAAGSMAVVLLALGAFIGSNVKSSTGERERAFAMQKAVQMLEETQTYKVTPTTTEPGPEMFEAQGLSYILTTAADVGAQDPLSGNPYNTASGRYKYVRRILSEAVTGDNDARKVTVQVYYQDPKAGGPAVKGKPLAVVSSVMRSSHSAVGAKTVIDIWAINIENIPRVYRSETSNDQQYLPSNTAARAAFDAALAKVQLANPALRFNVHYITRLGLGRDNLYRPYMNHGVPLHGSTRDPINRVYFYPGRLEDPVEYTKYYDYTGIHGNLAVYLSGSTATNQGNYVLADQFNHVLRTPQEYGTDNPPGESEMSLHQFLAAMLDTTSTANRFRNSIVVNLHGELFPALALRNYADAAKDPVDYDTDTDQTDIESIPLKRRIVTHPYMLNTPASTPVRLLVHPFMSDGSDTPSSATAATNQKYVGIDSTFPTNARKARITIKGIKNFLAEQDGSAGITAADVKIDVLRRIRQSNGSNDYTYYQRFALWPGGNCPNFDHTGPHVSSEDSSGPDPTFPSSGNDLRIELTDLDYDMRKASDNGIFYGVDTSLPEQKLHDLQYFPDPFLPFLDVATSDADQKPRNSARAIIEFKLNTTGTYSAIGQRFEVVTQFYDASGNVYPTSPTGAGYSVTYFYYGGAWDGTKNVYTNTVPLTDQFQLVGDPRHVPYADARAYGLYNPYFNKWQSDDPLYKTIANKTGDANKCMPPPLNPLLPASLNPPAEGANYRIHFPLSDEDYSGVQFNVPAYLRMWREALMRNNMVFVNMAGQPMRFIGMGGEFALEHMVEEGSDLTISKKPWSGLSSEDAKAETNELFAGDKAPVIEQHSTNKWFSKPWIGELWPYESGPTWVANGNLPTGTSSTTFSREKQKDIDNFDLYADKDSPNGYKIASAHGFLSFLNSKTAGGDMLTEKEDGATAARTSDAGDKMMAAMNATLQSTLQAPYYFKLDGGTAWPEAETAVGINTRNVHAWLLPSTVTPPAYYGSSKGTTCFTLAPLLVTDLATSPTQAMVVLANHTSLNGKPAVAHVFDASVNAMLETFFDGTRQDIGAPNMKPVPRIKFSTPSEGASLAGSVPLTWNVQWTRPDGSDFTPFYANTFPNAAAGGPLDMCFFVKYREIGDTQWHIADIAGHATGGGPATPGETPNNTVVPIPYNGASTAPITVTWNTTGLSGQYMVRVEGYRTLDDTNTDLSLGGHYTYHDATVRLN